MLPPSRRRAAETLDEAVTQSYLMFAALSVSPERAPRALNAFVRPPDGFRPRM
jgi:hypothetical protein